MTDVDTLRAAYDDAEATAQKIMADRDEAMQKVRDKYDTKLRSANEAAADAQKALCDAEAAQALADRDVPESEKQRIADALGLKLPE